MVEKITDAQRKALVALSICGTGFHPRWKMAHVARGELGPAYPLKTLTTLQARGLVQPQHQVAVDLVESRVCKCACDRWQITADGKALVESWLVNKAKG
jgi:hypothetical protein